MTEFMRPQVTVEQIDDTVARYVVEPLERGFGYTLGNCMRRVLLSSLQGAAATSIRVEGVQHEFTPIDGVREDVTDIVLNVKNLVFRETGIGAGDAVATLSATGPATVTGADLKVPAEFELVNPDEVVATLNKGAKLEMSIRVGVGRGYVSADRNKRTEDPIGVITVDSLFSPVVRCAYVVE
ncbi:MAG: DNA-directed RNA polymerase subunit alpha, partial [Coriobacteriia bacterium]|nr:DNA-directed RNA polymerase subunit alpha [Coriobacteriia bacterium]